MLGQNTIGMRFMEKANVLGSVSLTWKLTDEDIEGDRESSWHNSRDSKTRTMAVVVGTDGRKTFEITTSKNEQSLRAD